MKTIISSILICCGLWTISCGFVKAQSNGYSLEFEDVIFLSLINQPIPANSSTSVAYSVPSNMVLKITQGAVVNKTNFQELLKIGNYYLNGYGFDEGTDNTNSTEWPVLWVPSGTTVTLSANNLNSSEYTPFKDPFITGVLFRKVAN